MEGTPATRARSYLKYHPRARSLAIVAGLGIALFTTLLALWVGLFVDLISTRGRIPNFGQLTPTEQARFLDDWRSLSIGERSVALRELGYGVPDEIPKKPCEIRSLVLAEPAAPLPGATANDLTAWAKERALVGNPYLEAMREHEIRWRAYLRAAIKQRLGASAADRYQPILTNENDLPLPGIGETNRTSYGVLSLVVRKRDSTSSWLVHRLAAFQLATTPDRGSLGREYLGWLLATAFVLIFARWGAMVLLHSMAARAVIDSVTRLRRAVYHHVTRQSTLVSRGGDSPEVQNLITRQLDQVQDALFVWMTLPVRYITQFVLLTAVILFVQPGMAVVLMLFGLLVWLTAGRITANFRRCARLASKRAHLRILLLLESLKLLRLTRAYSMELFNQSRVERQLADLAATQRVRYRGDAFGRPFLFLMGGVGGGILLYLAGRLILADTMTPGGLSVLAVSAVGLSLPIKNLLDGRRILRRGEESAKSVFDFLDRKTDAPAIADAEFMPAMAESLDFQDVTLRDAGSGRTYFKDLRLSIRAGERIGIVGSDETQKQMLIHLLLRLMDPSDGEVRIDGRNIKWSTIESLRSEIGVVLQNALIFNDTVLNNIGCGDPAYSSPQVIEAAKLAHAHQFVQKLPNGYDTPIGELGQLLRIGEQFRIALARAILRDPAIYVIEEPAIPLDDETKHLVDDTLARVLPGKTVLFLPHRITTLNACDRILLLHQGRVEAEGTHRDLLKSNDLYRHLYYLEFNRFGEE